MEKIVDTLLNLVLAGILVFAGIFILRSLFRFAWRFIRVALILMVAVLAAGYYFGFLDTLFSWWWF